MITLLLAAALLFPEPAIKDAFADRDGTLVVTDTASGDTYRYHAEAADEKLPPCSTFKIWNTTIGLETGLVTSADQPFWKWDGQKRFLPEWNQDQTLRSAFAVSCVPAYQNLARQIGPERMNHWLQTLGYGDENISAGIDVFWLPEAGRKTLLITPNEQVALLVKLTKGELPLQPHTLAVLKEVMLYQKTAKGALYGKTGTGDIGGGATLGWYVGYLESQGKTYAFAANLKGPSLTGKDTRDMVAQIFTAQGLL